MTHFCCHFLTEKCRISLKMWLNLHENSDITVYYHTHRSFLVQKETHQGHTFFRGYKCWHNKRLLTLLSVSVMTTIWSWWLLWLHANTMNVLLALSITPVMFAGAPEEASFRSDAPDCTVHTYSLREQNIFHYFNGICTFYDQSHLSSETFFLREWSVCLSESVNQ